MECLRKISLSTVENKQELKSCTLSLEFEFTPGQISGKKMKDVGSEGEKINHEASALTNSNIFNKYSFPTITPD